jgi:hypothetical protein
VILVRSGDVDHVHIRIGHQILIAGVASLDAELVAEGVSRILATGTDREQHGIGDSLEAIGEVVCDFARAKDAPTNGTIGGRYG